MKCNKAIGSTLLVGMICWGLADVARGELIKFRDDFESDTAGTSVTTADLDPVIGAGDIGGSWDIEQDNDGGACVQVLNDAQSETYGGPADGAYGSDNFLSMRRGDTSTRGVVIATGWDINETDKELVQLSFSIYIPSTIPGKQVVFAGRGAAAWSDRLFDLRFMTGGNVNFYDGSSYEDAGIDYVTDMWQPVELLADMKARTFSVTVGTATATGLYWEDSATSVKDVYIANNLNDAHFYVDDFQLMVVPEPSTLLLLGVGLAGLMIPRRRRR